MEQEILEGMILQLVVSSGSARSSAMEAIELAQQSKFGEAQAKLCEAKAQINEAHEAQTDMIIKEANGEGMPMSLIMCHGQDHLMTAMVVIDLAEKFVDVYKRIH